jgi:hypothetical protein
MNSVTIRRSTGLYNSGKAKIKGQTMIGFALFMFKQSANG